MKKFQELMEKYLLPLATRIQSNTYVNAISNGFSMVLPIIMMGAIFTLLTSLAIEPYQNFIVATNLKVIFGYASMVTTDMLALYVVFSVAYNLAKAKGYGSDAAIAGTISIAMFLLLIPLGTTVEAVVSKEVVSVTGVLTTSFLGARGLFMALIVGCLSTSIYCFILKKKITIKLPDTVPATISKSFSALIPAFIVLIVFSLIRFGFAQTSFETANNFVYEFIATPLGYLSSSPFSVLIFILVCQLLWFFGIHGFLVILPFVQTMFLPNSLENLSAYEAGVSVLPNAITYQHFGTYVLLGGSGAVLGLAILMAFLSKSKQYKTLGRLSLPSVFCGINEPIIFGIPLVLNPLFLIPFILVPILMFLIPYFLQFINIIPSLRGISMPLGTPALLYGWLEGGVPILLMQVGLIFVQMLVWFPFFRIADKQAYLEEIGEVKVDA